MAIKNHAVIKDQLQAHQSLNGKITESFLKGDKGDSAYEVAVEHGFVGTEEEWLESLIGPEGQQGIQGEKGDPGDDYVLTEADKEEIASLATVKDIKINSVSILDNGVANIPLASTTNYGLVKYGAGLTLDGSFLTIFKASNNQTKVGTASYSPIVPSNQHLSAFYGLAKAAGDTTQSASSNAVGTYTDEAKSAIKSMLGISEVQTVTVSGTDPVITAVDNTRYICGEVTSLSFTPCASGICDVIFTSGSTVAVLTLPSTVKMPDGFEVEANATYEINILDGVWGVYQSWTA